jgi:hypothetical protein
MTAQQQALPQRGCVRQLRFLFHHHWSQGVALPQFPVIEHDPTGDDAEQRRLPGTVTADQPDTLAGLHRERRAIKERQLAIGELPIGQGQERHLLKTSDE